MDRGAITRGSVVIARDKFTGEFHAIEYFVVKRMDNQVIVRNFEGNRRTFSVKDVAQINGYKARESTDWSDEETDSPKTNQVIYMA